MALPTAFKAVRESVAILKVLIGVLNEI